MEEYGGGTVVPLIFTSGPGTARSVPVTVGTTSSQFVFVDHTDELTEVITGRLVLDIASGKVALVPPPGPGVATCRVPLVV
jgi:hypothetical protein